MKEHFLVTVRCPRLAGHVLAQREMEKRRSPLVHRFRPFGAGIFEALGVYRPMTLVLRGANRARVRSHSGHFQPKPFSVFCPSPRLQAKNFAPGSLQSDDCQLGGPGASPGLSCFVMTTDERMNSRAVDHRLDEPRQIIPQHGCVPAAPASVSPGAVIVPAEPDRANRKGVACCRRSCRCRRACSNLRSRAA